MKLLFITFLYALCFYGNINAENKTIPIKEVPKQIPDTNKPHSPTKVNVQAWIEGNMLTIEFLQSEGDASIVLDCINSNTTAEFTYSTISPIMIDLTPFGDIYSFTIGTSIGKMYKGYIGISESIY